MTHCGKCHTCGSDLQRTPKGEFCPECRAVRRYPSHEAKVPRGFRCPLTGSVEGHGDMTRIVRQWDKEHYIG